MQTTPLKPKELKSFRDHLLDGELFLKLATHFVDEAVKESGSDAELGTSFKRYYKAALQAVTEENTAEVSALAGSPIEKMFLNSLILDFIKNDGLGLLVHSTFDDAPAEIFDFRGLLKKFKDFVSWFDENKPAETMEGFLNEVVRRGEMSQDERDDFTRWIFRYRFIPLDNSYHMTLQPRFPEIKINTRPIRADIYFWIPSKPDINIIVECDGFQYHSGKESFISDRQRDRAFKFRGYDVLRFSGSEINADPIQTSHQLAEYLWQLNPG